jgi:hypothetical protein
VLLNSLGGNIIDTFGDTSRAFIVGQGFTRMVPIGLCLGEFFVREDEESIFELVAIWPDRMENPECRVLLIYVLVLLIEACDEAGGL